jgi:hypothetical protein
MMLSAKAVLLEKLAELGKHFRAMRFGQLLVMLASDSESVADATDQGLLETIEAKLAAGVFPSATGLPPEDQYRVKLLGELDRLALQFPGKSLGKIVAELACFAQRAEYDVDDPGLINAASVTTGAAAGTP